MYLLGYDVGSSSVKATLMEAETGMVVASAASPKKEMPITAHASGWAEQAPALWWEHIKKATAQILAMAEVDPAEIAAIGISYQMHGLVLIDKNGQVLRDAIIWCDSRAVGIGEKAAEAIGKEKCLKRLLNFPGNFTASKLKWVMEHEPDIFKQTHKMMLPGDYIAFKLTGQIKTTPSGLSEGILWDFQDQQAAAIVLDQYGIDQGLLPEVVPTFSVQGELTSSAAAELQLAAGTKVSYRGGDQPNNALSLNVLEPGEIAATAGTSGVVYGIGEQSDYDPQSRVNTFVHVNHTPERPRYGVLLCLNGTGILNSWLKHNVMGGVEDYERMNELASQVPVGAQGLQILPYGNGAERTLGNRDINCSMHGLNFNTHHQAHLLRAGQEGIVFALNYGLDIMRQMNLKIEKVRAGNANMFLSPLFATAFATVTETSVELYDTDGSQGAARGAGLGAGIYKNYREMFVGLKKIRTIEPDTAAAGQYKQAYQDWLETLRKQLG